MAQEKEYGLLIAAIVAIVSIVGLVILFSRGNPTGGDIVVTDAPWCYSPIDPKNSWVFLVPDSSLDEAGMFPDYNRLRGTCVPIQSMFEYKMYSVEYYPVIFPDGTLHEPWKPEPLPQNPRPPPPT